MVDRIEPSGPVGVLALQGDFHAHASAVEKAGFRALEIRRPGELRGISALILPGGESTTMLKFLREEGLEEELLSFCREGGPVLATCAGVILLARRVTSPDQPSLGVLDVDVVRNGSGLHQGPQGHQDGAGSQDSGPARGRPGPPAPGSPGGRDLPPGTLPGEPGPCLVSGKGGGREGLIRTSRRPP